MGVKDVLSRKEGVIVGDDVLALFKYAQEHQFAIPAIVGASSRPKSTNYSQLIHRT
jgi:fructose-bisphosphate aldolase class II